MTGVDKNLATRERRDAFLRAVIAELQPANGRWPGLWTRLASLLDERDALEAELSRLREALRQQIHFAQTNADDVARLREERDAAEKRASDSR